MVVSQYERILANCCTHDPWQAVQYEYVTRFVDGMKSSLTATAIAMKL